MQRDPNTKSFTLISINVNNFHFFLFYFYGLVGFEVSCVQISKTRVLSFIIVEFTY